MKSHLLWLGMATLVSGSLLAWVVRYGTAVILPGLHRDFGADEAALGALAAAYFWPYALMQPFAGLFADWWGPRRSLAIWLTIAGLGTLLFAFAPTFPLALIGRALGGAGVGIVLVSAFSAIGHWFAPRHFGTVTGLYAATGPLGGLLAARPLAALVETLDWRLAFAAIAAWLFATALGALLFMPSLAERSAPRSDWRRAWSGLLRAARLRNLWLTGVYTFVALGILSSMQGLWTVPFLTDVYHLDAGEAAGVLQAWSLGLLVALPAWGYLVDRVSHSRKWTMIASIGLHIAPWLTLTLAPNGWPPGALFILFLYLALTNGCWMPAYALVRSTSPAAIAGTALGLLNFAFFLGAATFQQMSGVVLAVSGQQFGLAPAVSYQILFGLFVVSLALAAGALLATREQAAPA